MQIDLIADSSVASAPAGFTAAVQAAAQIYDLLFPGNYTINIRYGWGTWDNQVDPGLNGANGAEGGPVNGTTVSYATVKSWLTADATLPDEQQAIASLPASTSAFPGSANVFYVSSAQEKAFGVYTGSSSTVDGAIAFGTGSTSAYFLEGALHEIGHALGRTTDFYAGDPTIMDLFRYSSAGQYNWTGYTSSYFSLNGGRTDLADFSTVSDYADLAVDSLALNDPYDWMINGTAHTLTSLDIELMNVLGFGSTPALPNVIISAPTDVSVQAGQSISVITATSNPHGDSLTQYLYLDEGDNGHFTVNGTPQPDGQWITAGSSDVVQYVGGSSPGSDQIEVGIYDATTHSYAYSPLFSAITTGSQSTGPTDASWQVSGFGDFAGTGASEMLLRDSIGGDLEVYYVSNNSTGSDAEGASNGSNAAVSLGQVGLDWQVIGLGSFNGNANETDMLMQDTTTGALEVYDINNNTVTAAAAMGQVGLNWKVAGFGDFSGNTNETDMLLRDSNTGTFELYDISHNAITLAFAMGQVGLSWQIVGFGDFSGNVDETDMLLRDSNTGTLELYDISHNAITLAFAMGQVGLDWKVVGLGDFSGNANETDMLMQNSNTGVFELYDISNNTITSATSLGQLGLSGQFSIAGGGAPSSPSSFGQITTQPSPASTDTLFVFVGTFGQNTVQQFNPLTDTIELAATEFPNFAAVQSHMQQVGANTVITYDANDTISLVGVSEASLHASNFEFSYGYAQ